MARKILLADDSVTAQNMGRKILTDAGYDVITVNNGSAALKRVAEQKPDLIVLDVYMPGYSGLEVCARLKDAPDTSRIPILLTVGKLEPFKPEEATRVRADAFIVKPFEASELLSALTRLEDRIVPAQSEGARFSGSVSGVERFGGDPSTKKGSEDDADSGWKNRLRFPSKKKKEEPEPEPEPDFVTPSSFREFRRGGGKAPAGTTPFPLSTAPAAAQEPTVVPDIPRDITPEELDALSELAAKLDSVPAMEQAAPAVAQVVDAVAKVETPTPEAAAPEAIPEATIEQAPQVAPEPNEKAFEVAPPPIESSKAEVVEAPPAPEETAARGEVTFTREAAIAQEPAPIDREDEPTFAAATIPESVETAETPGEIAPTELPASVVESPAVETPAVEAAIQSSPDIASVESQKVEESPSVEPVPAVAASVRDASAADGSSPSAEELAEALRFLTPSQPDAVPQTLAEAGAALAHELAHAGPGRWVAEAVPLSPDEASGSLEAEMFRTFSGGQPAAAPGGNADGQHAGQASSAVAESPTPAVAESASVPTYSEEASEESAAPTTFADAVRNEENREEENAAAVSESVVSVTAEAGTQAEAASSENGPGGEEVMGKETKGKGGKSTWHQIRSGAPTGSDAVEAAKQFEETSKTMAAAASADNGSEASHIANIVDSVLADLRPKIVEEIAKQLAKK